MTRPPNDVTDRSRIVERMRTVTLGLVCALALFFRGAAWLVPSRFIVMPDSAALPLNALGLFFLACGVWAWRSHPSSLTRVFLAYAVGGAVHWGGSIGATSQDVEISLLMFYLAATALSDAALLDLALRFPHRRGRAAGPTAPIYLLAIVGLIAVPVAPFLPRPIVETGLGVVIVLTSILSIGAGLVFIARWFRATPTARLGQGLTPIAGQAPRTPIEELEVRVQLGQQPFLHLSLLPCLVSSPSSEWRI